MLKKRKPHHAHCPYDSVWSFKLSFEGNAQHAYDCRSKYCLCEVKTGTRWLHKQQWHMGGQTVKTTLHWANIECSLLKWTGIFPCWSRCATNIQLADTFFPLNSQSGSRSAMEASRGTAAWEMFWHLAYRWVCWATLSQSRLYVVLTGASPQDTSRTIIAWVNKEWEEMRSQNSHYPQYHHSVLWFTSLVGHHLSVFSPGLCKVVDVCCTEIFGTNTSTRIWHLLRGWWKSMNREKTLNVNTEVSDVPSPGADKQRREMSDWIWNDSNEIQCHATSTALIPTWFKCWAAVLSPETS